MRRMNLRWLRRGQFLSAPAAFIPTKRHSLKWARYLWRINMAVLVNLTFASTLIAQHYYVSPNGNDNNAGTSNLTPWQTIERVNNFAFPAGSTVSFEGGQTFTGCLVFNNGNVPSSSASVPFTVNSYGTGMATISSDCSGTSAAAITGDNVHGFTMDGLRIVNGGSTIYGVLLENQSSTAPTQNITVKNSEITGFAPVSGSPNGGEIWVVGFAMNGNNGPLNNVQILNNTLHGAAVTSGDGVGVGGYGYGENITNVLVQGNTIYNLGMPASSTGAAILANGWNQATIQYNLIHDIGANVTSCGGASGIEVYASNKLTVRFNEVFNVQPSPNYTAGCDWDGIDLDGGTTNSVVEYNYTHHNAGAALLAYDSNPTGTTWGPNIYRYNISEDDDWAKAEGGLFAIVPNPPPHAISIYGNTFFDHVTTQKSMTSSSACFLYGYTSGAWASGSLVADNICVMNDSDKYGRNGNFIYNPNGESGMILSNNLYYTTGSSPIWRWGGTQIQGISNWVIANHETNPVFGDPLLSSGGNGGTCTWTPSAGNGPQACPQAYQLQAGSLALGEGVAMASSGGVDYFQSPLSEPPSIGAYSGTGGSQVPPAGTPPSAPGNLTATATSVDHVDLSWTASPGAWSYNIYRSNDSGFTPSTANLVAAGVADAAFGDSGLTFGTTYYYQVEAVNGAGASAPSNEAPITTPQQPQYYVSPSGNDSNPGTLSQPWQTISKVNSFTFPQGAIVAFKGGETFTDCLVFNAKNVTSSSAVNPFIVTSYDGTATISSNCTGSSAAITGDSVNGFTVDGLKIVNGGSTIYGVLLENQSTTWPTQTMVVKNSEITGFAPVSGSPNGGEIWIIGYAINGNHGPLNDIQILNNSLHGASVTSPDGVGVGGYGYGQNISNVLVQGNTIYNLGMPTSANGAGILVGGWNTGTVKHNQIHDIGANVTSCGGVSGIESYNANGVTIAFNEVFNVQPFPAYTAGCDWNGIDLDGGSTNSTVEYNYTHHNAGAGYLGYNGNPSGTTWGPNTYRYNISENDDWDAAEGGAFVIVPNAPPNPAYIYGNTFFNNLAERGGASPACFYFGYTAGAWASGSLVEDNICAIENPGGGVRMYDNSNGQTGMTLSNNLYYSSASPSWLWGSTSYTDISSWQGTGLETSAIWGNPLFANPGNGGTCSWTPGSGSGPQPCPQAYRLGIGSAASGNGVAVSGNEAVDYYQNELTTLPSIGADSGSGAGTSTALITASDLQVSEYGAIPSTYQPAAGLVITWNGLFRYGTNSWDGYQDHTKGTDANAPSIDIGTATGSGMSNTGSLNFNKPVTIPSLYVTNWDWWKQDVVLKGYTNIGDTTPVITITIPYSKIAGHATGTTTGAWVQVTGLSAIPIQRLEVTSTKDSSTAQYGAALVDDITLHY
jgi:Right handed beta helix region